jgi:hypothetical protein
MDYPPPLITLDDGGEHIVINNHSYPSGIGAFDKVNVSSLIDPFYDVK